MSSNSIHELTAELRSESEIHGSVLRKLAAEAAIVITSLLVPIVKDLARTLVKN